MAKPKRVKMTLYTVDDHYGEFVTLTVLEGVDRGTDRYYFSEMLPNIPQTATFKWDTRVSPDPITAVRRYITDMEGHIDGLNVGLSRSHILLTHAQELLQSLEKQANVSLKENETQHNKPAVITGDGQ